MILAHATVNPGHIPLSWKILLSGYAPEYVYEQGRFDRSLPFAELKRRGHVNAAAQAADKAPDFSQRIRAKGIHPMKRLVLDRDASRWASRRSAPGRPSPGGPVEDGRRKERRRPVRGGDL